MLRPGGILDIRALPADTTFRLRTGQRVLVEVGVSSGDRESVGLDRRLCPARERRWRSRYECFKFVIYMKEGFHAADLAEQVGAIGGRFNLISVSGRLAGVTVFSPDNVVGHAWRARSWPGVQVSELSHPSCHFFAPPWCLSPSWLSRPVPVDTGAPVPGDGIIQVQPGDTVTMTYRQPDGRVLEARVGVPVR